MGNAASAVPPPQTSGTAGPSAADAEAAQTRDFAPGPDGVYRKHQGDVLYVTKNRAKPHRCNDRVEDVIQALFEGNPLLTVPPRVCDAPAMSRVRTGQGTGGALPLPKPPAAEERYVRGEETTGRMVRLMEGAERRDEDNGWFVPFLRSVSVGREG